MDKKKRREAIIAEYLEGGITLRDLGQKHGINHQTIHRWVKDFREGKVVRDELVAKGSIGKDQTLTREEVSEIRRLRRELEDAQLLNKLLNAMIDIAEDDLGVPIRKKSGTKR